MLRVLTSTVFALSLSLQQAMAQVPDNVAGVTILGGWRGNDDVHHAALLIELAPGWKTYWRAAGEGGIPPIFDWTTSQNLATAEVHFPVPQIFDQNGLRSFGYETRVVFPLRIRPERPGVEIVLDGQVDLGVCLDVCIPVRLGFSALLPPTGEQYAAEIRKALADRPLTANEAGLSEISCAVEPISDGLKVTATVDLQGRDTPEAVIMEVADQNVWVSHARASLSGGTLSATAEMVPPDAQPFFLARDSLRVTFLNSETAVEFRGCR